MNEIEKRNKSYIDRILRTCKLTDFEKTKYIEYAKILVKKQYLDICTRSGITFLYSLEHFFNADISSVIPPDCYGLNYVDVDDTLYCNLENVLSSIKLPKYKSDLENRIKWLSSIFNLSIDEREYLTFIYLINNNTFMKDILNATYSGYHYITENGPPEAIGECLCKKGIFENITKLNGQLWTIITPYYEKLLKCDNLNTKLKFEKYLIGKIQKTDLTLKDFDYIKQLPLIIKILKSASKQNKIGVNILLTGICGSGKTELAKRLSIEAGLNCYAVATDRNDEEITRAERLADLNLKQAVLGKVSNACILCDEAEDIFNRGFGDNGTSSKGYLNRILENNQVPILYTTNNVYGMDNAFLRRFNYILETPELDKDKRFNLWNRITKKNKLDVSKEKLEELSELYNIQPAIIANAVETSKLIDGDEDTFENIIESVATKVNKKSNIKSDSTFDMNDYNLNLLNTDLDIVKLFNQIKNCGKLNFSMCFYGMSGTSKTSVALYLSKLLNIEIVRKSCGDLLSCYVGDTEHLIQEAFQEARGKKAILLIDEGDTFLRSREGALRSWEVSMTNQFLQEMEHFEYPFIVSTNLMNNLDDAVLRRFVFKIEFKPLSKEQVKIAMKHFFNFESDFYINGLTSGDFAVVKRKCSFLDIKEESKICEMLTSEVRLKKDKSLQNTVGF